MKIVFNIDGSIKYKELGNYIQQGNNGVDYVEVAVEGRSTDTYTLSAIFELPNGDTNTITASDTIEIGVDGTNYGGRKITLTSAQTLYAGELKMSLRLVDLSERILYTYKTSFTINKTPFIASEQSISEAQWNQLMAMLGTYQVKYALNNVRFYSSLTDATNDVTNLAEGQIALVKDTTTGYLKIYTKANGVLSLTNLGDLVNVLAEIPNKQNKLVAGSHIVIDPNTNVISAESGITSFEGPYDSYEDLPEASASTIGIIYLVKTIDAEVGNELEEYITIQEEDEGVISYRWELLGTTKVNLDEYQRHDEMTTSLSVIKTFPTVSINGATFNTYSAQFVGNIGYYSYFNILRNDVKCTEADAKLWLRKMVGYDTLPLFDSENPKLEFIIFSSPYDYYDTTDSVLMIKAQSLVIAKLQYSEVEGLRAYLIDSLPIKQMETDIANKTDKITKSATTFTATKLKGSDLWKCIGGGFVNVEGALFLNVGGLNYKNLFINIELASGTNNYSGYAMALDTSHKLTILDISVSGLQNNDSLYDVVASNVKKLGDITAIPYFADSTNKNFVLGKSGAISTTKTRTNNYFFVGDTASYGSTYANNGLSNIVCIGGSVLVDNGIANNSVIIGRDLSSSGGDVSHNVVIGFGTSVGGNYNTGLGDSSLFYVNGYSNYATAIGHKTTSATNSVAIGSYAKSYIQNHISFDGYQNDNGTGVVNRTLDLLNPSKIFFRYENVVEGRTQTSQYGSGKTLQDLLDTLATKTYVDTQIEALTGVTHKYQHNIVIKKQIENYVYAQINVQIISDSATPITLATLSNLIPSSQTIANGFIGTSDGGTIRQVCGISYDEGNLWATTYGATGYSGTSSFVADSVTDTVVQIF